MQQSVIGIDIGGTNFRIGAVDQNGSVTGFEKKSSAVLTAGDAVENLTREIQKFLTKNGKEGVAAVSVGFPSIVSKDKRVLYNTPNLKGFDGIDLTGALEERLMLPVFIDRDVNFLLQSDIRTLGLDPAATILGFYVGTGFGNAVYINGRFHAGKNGVAGELGHIPLFGVTERCTCGNVGCSETRCSGRHLTALVDEAFPDTDIADIFLNNGSDAKIISFVQDLAIPIATEINILDPDYAVIAGGVVFMKGFPKETLEAAVRERVRRPFPAQNLQILYSKHTQKSGVVGGGLFAHAHLHSCEAGRLTKKQ